jgi:hypothetical protein
MLLPSLSFKYTARGIKWVMQTGCKEYGHSDPWEGVRMWSLVWANMNNRQENGCYQESHMFITAGGK